MCHLLPGCFSSRKRGEATPVLKNLHELLERQESAGETAVRQKWQATRALNRSCADEQIGVDKLEGYSGRGSLGHQLIGFILEDRGP